MRLARIFLAITTVSMSAAVGAAETFKIATLAPEGSAWMTEMRAGAKEIEKRTEGRVKFKFYGGGVQGNDKQVLRKMRIGQLHGGAFVSSGLRMLQPDSELFGLPLLFNSADEVHYVREQMDDKLRQNLEDAGYVNFGFSGTGFAYLMSNKPSSTLKDLDGQKVWIPEGDEVSFAALQALGVAPTLMPLTDVLTGLQTDLIDSVSASPVGAVVLQWHTKLRYITDLPLSYIYAALVIDKKHFSKLSKDDQAIVREVMERIYKKADEASFTDNDQAMQALLDSGLELVPPDSGQVPKWREIVAESNRAIAERGRFSGELLDELLGHLQTFRSGATVQSEDDTRP